MNVRRGLSLIEVIVVIAIIAVMLALILPAVQRIRELAIRTRSVNNVRQIQLALQNYTTKFEGQLPTVDGHKGSPNRALSISVAILPEIEQGALYHRVFVLNQTQSKNWSLYVPQYVSPADPTVTEKNVTGAIRATLSISLPSSPARLSQHHSPMVFPTRSQSESIMLLAVLRPFSTTNSTDLGSPAIARRLPTVGLVHF
jgi:prepilin-type N-terminal cleavage/methylation domain-containing protein